MNNKNAYILDDRAILYINGEDAKEFLQNLISNDIKKVNDKNMIFKLKEKRQIDRNLINTLKNKKISSLIK